MDCKTCVGCGEQKPLDQFYSTVRSRKAGSRREYASRCKPCHNAHTKGYDPRNPATPRTTPEDRFSSKVDKGDGSGCHIWRGRLNADGRPCFMGPGNRSWLAQRYAWESLNGPLPDRTPVRANCGTDLCVRSTHMLAVRYPAYDPQMVTKRCSICKESKPVSMFTGRGNGKAGKRLSGRCKPCNTAYLKAYNFGPSLDDFRAMFEAQNGRCAICGRLAEEAGKRSLSVDHSHRTGRVRALLCGPCNSALGLLNEDPARIRAAAEYVERWNPVIASSRAPAT